MLFEVNQAAIKTSLTRQVVIGLIDITIVIAFSTLFFHFELAPLYHWVQSINGSLLVLITYSIYRLVSLFAFDGTIGMKLLQSVLLNGEQKTLTIKEKLLAALFILYRGVNYYDYKSVIKTEAENL